NRYFFRKRADDQQQFSICMREGTESDDQVLVDPVSFGIGPYTAVQILCISPDARLLAYQVKQGGEDSGRVRIVDVTSRTHLSDELPGGFVRSFAFTPDGRGFYYVHEASNSNQRIYHAAFHHIFG